MAEWANAIYDALTLFREEAERTLSLDEILPYWDVTNLNEGDDEEGLLSSFAQAIHGDIKAAAVCVYPQWVPFAVKHFAGQNIHVGTVANFPDGDQDLMDVEREIRTSVVQGADEIDVVFPYRRYLNGERDAVFEFVSHCKATCGHALLKVILETGVLQDLAVIVDATKLAALAGADFIKTSTGKIPNGATLEAATAILLAIQIVQPECQQIVGLKVAGGVRTLQQASHYQLLATKLMGEDWLDPRHFRIGASRLSA